VIVYLFDLKFKNKRQFDALKRRFYYNFNKKLSSLVRQNTKSVWVAKESDGPEIDAFLSRFAREIEAYKIRCKKIERL